MHNVLMNERMQSQICIRVALKYVACWLGLMIRKLQNDTGNLTQEMLVRWEYNLALETD